MSAIERVGGHDLISGPGDIENGDGRCGRTRSQCQCGRAAFQGRNPLFENIMGWIYYARVGIPEFGDRAECYRLLEILKNKGGSLVNWDRPGPGGRVWRCPAWI